jgi:hypothetical protein
LAGTPEVVAARAEVARIVIDLAAERPATRLVRAREALARALEVTADGDVEPPSDGRRNPADRRRAAQWLIGVWRDVAYDAALAGVDGERPRDPDLMEETRALGLAVPDGVMSSFLARLDDAARRLDVSASPELTVDVLALRWPSRGG